MECAFGILSNKRRIFQRPFNISPHLTVDNVKVCVFLHNFFFAREILICLRTGLEDVPDGQPVRGRLTANNVRNKVAEYFLTDAGAVTWQMSKI